MVESVTVRRLLDVIETRLTRLQEFAGIALETYSSDHGIQDRVERNFEVCIQACIDLGSHILADLVHPMPQTYREVFVRMAEEALIPADLGERLQQMAAFRNLLVHGYTEIVAAKVHHNLNHLSDIRQYVDSISVYVSQHEEP